jgi:chaperonin cofactor prefoldin
MTDAEKFEKLKSRVEQLSVKRMAAEAEARRLSEELEAAKARIRETYGVEIEDFASAIEVMRKECESMLAELETAVSDAEAKMPAEEASR